MKLIKYFVPVFKKKNKVEETRHCYKAVSFTLILIPYNSNLNLPSGVGDNRRFESQKSSEIEDSYRFQYT